MKIKLVTAGKLVKELMIPSFAMIPEVIYWGERFFALPCKADQGNIDWVKHPDGGIPLEYEEVFGYIAPNYIP